MITPQRIIAIDWSGAKGERQRHKGIALAEWTPDFDLKIRVGCSREEVAELLEVAARVTPQLVVGFDFAFSFPEWFVLRQGGCIAKVWDAAVRDGERWLQDMEYPFWDRKQWPELQNQPRLRKTDQSSAGGSPKSIFKLVGNGQVGPGSIRGMKYLARLQQAGFSIWPFDAVRFPLIIEIYPTGCYDKARRCLGDALQEQLANLGFKITSGVASLLQSSGDARDAACALMRMVEERNSFAELTQATDPTTLLEGKIWRPLKSCSTRSLTATHELTASPVN